MMMMIIIIIVVVIIIMLREKKWPWMLMDGTFVVDSDLLPQWLQPLADSIYISYIWKRIGS